MEFRSKETPEFVRTVLPIVDHFDEAEEGGSHHYRKGLWTEEEDKILMEYVEVHGKGHWNSIAKNTGLKRCGKSCRLRWINYLDPNVKRDNFSEDEDDLIIRLHKLLGNRWSLIAGRIPGRTDNQVKNHWNAHLGKQNEGAKKQRTESCLPSPDTNTAPKSNDENKNITTKNAELENTFSLVENNNPIVDASFYQKVDTFFADDHNKKCVTWKDELEQQMDVHQSLLMLDSDELLQYDFGWNMEQQDLTLL